MAFIVDENRQEKTTRRQIPVPNEFRLMRLKRNIVMEIVDSRRTKPEKIVHCVREPMVRQWKPEVLFSLVTIDIRRYRYINDTLSIKYS